MKNAKTIISGMSVLTIMAAAFVVVSPANAAPLTPAQITERKAKVGAIIASEKAGDYSSWTTAVKNLDADAPILNKVTSDNFSKYTEARSYQAKAIHIFKNLGIRPGFRFIR